MEVGDWIIYELSDSEKQASVKELTATKHLANWSLPALVKRVNETTCVVGPWGEFSDERQVPYSQVRKLAGKVPPILMKDNLAHLEKANPKRIKHWTLSDPHAAPPMEWRDILTKAALKLKDEKRAKPETQRKRRKASTSSVEEIPSSAPEQEGE